MQNRFFILHSVKSALGALALVAAFTMPVLAQSSETDKPSEEKVAAQPAKEDSLDDLFADLARQISVADAQATSRKIWRKWTDSGSETINALMSFAAEAMNDRKNSQALDMLDQVIVLMPDYAEGWNRRATLYYSMRKFGNSIADIEQTLRLEPRHFGALAGLAMIFQQTEQKEKALKAWYKVLEIFPANKQAQKAVIELEETLAGRRT